MELWHSDFAEYANSKQKEVLGISLFDCAISFQNFNNFNDVKFCLDVLMVCTQREVQQEHTFDGEECAHGKGEPWGEGGFNIFIVLKLQLCNSDLISQSIISTRHWINQF